MNQPVYIYTLSDPRTNFVRYVGKARNPKGRYSGHMNSTSATHRAKWINSLKALALSPKMEIIEEVAEDGWQEAERFWIESLRQMGCDLTNHTGGGEGHYFADQFLRDKISKSVKRYLESRSETEKLEYSENMSRATKGRKHSKEQILKMKTSIAEAWQDPEKRARFLSGNKKSRTPQCYAKISKALSGKPLNEAHKKKLRESRDRYLRRIGKR